MWASNFILSHPSEQWYSIRLTSGERSLAEKGVCVCVWRLFFLEMNFDMDSFLVLLISLTEVIC